MNNMNTNGWFYSAFFCGILPVAFAQNVADAVPAQGEVKVVIENKAFVPASETSAPVSMENSPADADASVKASNADAQFVASAGSILDEKFEEYAKSHGIDVYGTPLQGSRICYYRAQQVVNTSDRSDFAQKRSLAFSRAYNKAVIEHIFSRFGASVSQETGSFFSEDSSNRNDPPLSLENAKRGLLEKMKKLSEAEVDAKLKDLGVDPDQFSEKPLSEKKDLCRDTIVRRSVQKAFGSCSGLSVANTFEGHEGDVYTIGVVVKFDPLTEGIARAMANGQRPNVASRKGVPVSTFLGADANAMVQTFGTRLYYDENGDPALLSFGQWGSSFTGNDQRKLARWQEYALEQAYHVALMDMDFFLAGTLSYEGTPEMGGEFAESLNFTKGESLPTPEEAESVLSRLQKKYIKTASGKMRGRSKVYSKLIRHPNGSIIAVSVVNWSYPILDAHLSRPEMPKTTTPVIKGDSSKAVRSGIDFDF